MPTSSKPVKLRKAAVAAGSVCSGIPGLQPAIAGSTANSHLVCILKGAVPTNDFGNRLCRRMASAFQAKLQPNSVSRLLTGGKARPADTIIALTVTVKSPYVLTAIAKSGTAAQWRAAATRTSPPIDITVSDARLNDTAIENLAQSARFLMP